MKILISNDDGIHAPGLKALINAVESLNFVTSVITVAPDRDRSAASNSLTLDSPLRVTKVADNRFCVNGTPTDCVHLALTGLLEEEPDLVVSGINNGANLGDDILYSGTVAAATEGRFLGLPAIAVSLDCHGDKENRYFETAAEVVKRILTRIQNEPLPKTTVLNVNVPNCPVEQVKGIRSVRLGHRHRAEPIIKDKDPRGRDIFWVGPAGRGQDAGEGTDFYAVSQQYVSLTPLQVDLTQYDVLEPLSQWSSAFALAEEKV
ncbi:MAG: 5'/3'-nucleotidase SurE [Legionellales bacterium]|nr:5'/3'-nucleotidase SurE [Legionellales bacterium]